MLNTLIVCDDNDIEVGDFFNKCRIKTEKIFATSKLQIEKTVVSGNMVFEMVVPILANNINSNPFLFVCYSHGSENELLKNGITPFISMDYEVECLRNSIAFCYACKTGKNLGKALCENGTLCFIGYNEDVTIQTYFGAEDSFIESATIGIEFFLKGNSTGQTLKFIKERYTSLIDDFYLKDMLTATLFMQNRDALILHGSSELTINDL